MADRNDVMHACGIILASEAIVRATLPRPCARRHIDRVRWFLVHAICNVVVAVYAWNDTKGMLLDDDRACAPGQDVTYLPITLVVALHVWHVLARASMLRVPNLCGGRERWRATR